MLAEQGPADLAICSAQRRCPDQHEVLGGPLSPRVDVNLAEWLGFLAVIGLVVLACGLVLHSRVDRRLKAILCAALALRVAGAAGYWMVSEAYGGSDALVYYAWGARYAERFAVLDLSPIFDREWWRFHQWWGTQFVYFLSGIALALVGASVLGGFLVFALAGFAGLLGFGAAFTHQRPHVPAWRYLRWILLFPSLWFWTAAIGKEAVLLAGVGLAVAGYVRLGRLSGWLLSIGGLTLVFAIRPQVAAVTVFAMVLGYWIASLRKLTTSSFLQGILILAVGLWIVQYSLSVVGAGGLDLEGVQDYFESEASGAPGAGDGSGDRRVGPFGLLMAFGDILFRPFPWEVNNGFSAVASLEIWGFWFLAWVKRRNVSEAIRHWHSDRLLSFSLIFILVYAGSLGLLATNLGIITRQRCVLFPFLFFLFEAFPASRTASRRNVPAVETLPDPGGWAVACAPST